MSLRVCAESGCPQLTEVTRCPEHTRAKDLARGSRQARGYGAAHTRTRRQWTRLVAAGRVICWRCGRRISPLEAWDMGHDDHDRTQYRGPEHVKCNRATAGR